MSRCKYCWTLGSVSSFDLNPDVLCGLQHWAGLVVPVLWGDHVWILLLLSMQWNVKRFRLYQEVFGHSWYFHWGFITNTVKDTSSVSVYSVFTKTCCLWKTRTVTWKPDKAPHTPHSRFSCVLLRMYTYFTIKITHKPQLDHLFTVRKQVFQQMLDKSHCYREKHKRPSTFLWPLKLKCQFWRGQKHRSARRRHKEDKAMKASDKQPLFFSALWQYHTNIITLIHAVLLCLCMGGVQMRQFNCALLIGKQTSCGAWQEASPEPLLSTEQHTGQQTVKFKN